MKLNWRDFNLGLIVNTPKGIGSIMSVHEKENRIEIFLNDDKTIEPFKIEELGMFPGQFRLGLTQQIGQFILYFARYENRQRDYHNSIYGMSTKESKKLTAGDLHQRISKKFKESELPTEIKQTWTKFQPEFDELVSIRNTIAHGYMFHLNESLELDFDSILFENPKGKTVTLQMDQIYQLTERTHNLLYSSMSFFDSTYELFKNKNL